MTRTKREIEIDSAKEDESERKKEGGRRVEERFANKHIILSMHTMPFAAALCINRFFILVVAVDVYMCVSGTTLNIAYMPAEKH